MKNTVIVVLVLVVLFVLVGFIRQAHRNKDLRNWNERLKSQVNDLEGKLNEKESNKVLDATSR